MEKFGHQFAKSDGIRPAGWARLHAGRLRGICMLPDEVEQIIARGLHKLGTEENIVMNVVHPNGQRPHGERDVIALQADS